ncbi:MAG: hypothetical protein ACRD19_15080 [Terriglobia bacterium]
MPPTASSDAIARTRELLSEARKEIESVALPDEIELLVKSHIAQAAAVLARAEFLARYRPPPAGVTLSR